MQSLPSIIHSFICSFNLSFSTDFLNCYVFWPLEIEWKQDRRLSLSLRNLHDSVNLNTLLLHIVLYQRVPNTEVNQRSVLQTVVIKTCILLSENKPPPGPPAQTSMGATRQEAKCYSTVNKKREQTQCSGPAEEPPKKTVTQTQNHPPSWHMVHSTMIHFHDESRE